MSAGPEPLPPEEFRKLLEFELPRWNLTAPDTTVAALARFLAELDRWRRRLNLTGRLSPSDLVSHALESVLGAPFLPDGARVVDIGTGGGFPGVPLAVWRPDLELTWLEPREKRAAFLRHVARTLVEMGLCGSDDDVLFVRPRHVRWAYVLYDHAWSEARETVTAWLEQQRIVPAGRYGAWNYSSMEDALTMGRDAAARASALADA